MPQVTTVSDYLRPFPRRCRSAGEEDRVGQRQSLRRGFLCRGPWYPQAGALEARVRGAAQEGRELLQAAGRRWGTYTYEQLCLLL